MALFGAFSALCGLSNSLGMLVFARVLQGLAGGPLMPLSQTLLLRIFPKEKAAAATALWAMTTLVAPVMGPILGGWLCDNYTWPTIFYINVPIALGCSVVAWRMLKRYEQALTRLPIDKVGLALLVVFVAALQLMLDLGKEHDWFESNLICVLALIAAIGFAAFLIWEFTDRHPVVDLRVFRHRGFVISVITLAFGYGAFFGANVLTPLWLQSWMGYTATWSGMTTAWSGVLAIFFAPVAGALMSRFNVDPRRLIFFGVLWLGLVSAYRSLATTDMTYWQISLPLLVTGLGMPFFFVPVTALGLGCVNVEETASAAGLMSFLRTLSGAVATSMVTTSWEDGSTVMHARLVGELDRSGEMARSLSAMGMTPDAVRSALDNLLTSQSVMLSTNEMMAWVAALFLFAASVIWLAPKPMHAIDMSQAGH
jgi:DHA2 family multidrug resistance protein